MNERDKQIIKETVIAQIKWLPARVIVVATLSIIVIRLLGEEEA